MLESSLIYSVLVFTAVVGLLQVSSSYNGSLLFTFFKEKYIAVIFAILTTGGSLVAFFTWNYWGQTGVVEGSQQFGLFLLSALVAVVFSASVSLLIRNKPVKRAIVYLASRDIRKPSSNLGLVPGKEGEK
jgi:hypothetical protein